MQNTATKEAPRPLVERSPMNEKLTPDNFLAGKTETMIFPKTVKLQLDDGAGFVTFFPGTQEVPKELVNHWWLKANGVAPYNKSRIVIRAPGDPADRNRIEQMTERELAYLKDKGYLMNSTQEAQLFFDGLEPLMRPEFLKSVDDWWAQKNPARGRKK